MANNKSALESLAVGNPKLKDYCCQGLGAFLPADKIHIRVPNTKQIYCSIALDEAALKDMPDENRWDYVLDYNGEVFFIEIHPASTSEIKTMIKKLDGLFKWLRIINANILSLPPKNRVFYWVSSGKNRILPSSSQAKQLALKKIVPVGTIWDYSRL